MKISILFHRLGPYHHTRLNALADISELTAIEFCSVDKTYAWDSVEQSTLFNHITLFSDADIEDKDVEDIKKMLWRVLDGQMPDVVAVPGWACKGALLALSWCNQRKIPAIVMSASASPYQEKRLLFKEAIKRKLITLFSAGLVGGSKQLDYLASLGLPCEQLFVGYNVVDNAYFAAGADTARREATTFRVNLKLPKHYFLVSCRFIWEKNLPNFLLAYAAYKNQTGENAWPLVLLGDGPLKADVLKLRDELNIGAHLLLPGFKQYGELPTYYGLATALILPSISETWGLVVNEALASGLPVLVSNRCGCACDLIVEGKNGFIFDPYDVDALTGLLLRVASGSYNLEAMGMASRDMISHWAPETFAENLLKAADAALKAPRPKITLLDKALLWALIRR